MPPIVLSHSLPLPRGWPLHVPSTVVRFPELAKMPYAFSMYYYYVHGFATSSKRTIVRAVTRVNECLKYAAW